MAVRREQKASSAILLYAGKQYPTELVRSAKAIKTHLSKCVNRLSFNALFGIDENPAIKKISS